MNMNFWVIYTALALAMGVAASIYLFVWWLRHRGGDRYPLYWALALFLMYWFLLSSLLKYMGMVMTVESFNFAFALTFPITFVALSLIFMGIIGAMHIRVNLKAVYVFLWWFLGGMVFFAYEFIISKGVIQTHTLPVVGNLAFYLPLRLLIIFTAVRWVWLMGSRKNLGSLGALLIAGESVLGIIRNLLIVKYVLAYPPQFWYIVLTDLKIFFILQTASIFLLVFGFFFLHRFSKGNVLP